MKKPISFLFSIIKNQKVRFARVSLGLIIVKIISTMIPVLIGQGIDIIASVHGTITGDSGILLKVIKFLAEIAVVTQLQITLLLFSVAGVALFFLVPYQQKVQTRWTQDIVLGVTTSWLETLFGKDLRFFQGANSGRTANVIERGFHAYEKLLGQSLGVILPVFFEAAISIAVLAQLGGTVTLSFMFISVSFQAALTLLIIQKRRPLISDLNEIEDQAAEQMVDLIGKGLIFQLYQSSGIALKRLEKVYSDYADQCVKISFSGTQLSMLPSHFQNLGSFVALILGFYLVKEQNQSVGQVLILLSFFNRFSQATGDCVGAFRTLDQFSLDVKETEKFLLSPDFFRNGKAVENVESLKIAAGSYQRPGVCLEISEEIVFQKGDRVALIGASGGGKSTLLETFAGLDASSREQVQINCTKLSDLSSQNQLDMTRYCPQDPMIFSGSFSENIFHQGSEKQKLVSDLGLENLMSSDRKEISGSEISGGEARRTSLVRTLSNNAGIFLFDEPTSGLDEGLRGQAWSTIFGETKNSILLAVTHDQDFLSSFNKIIRVDQGKVELLKWQ